MVPVFSFPQKEPELPVEAEVLWMTHFLACYVSLFTFHRFSHKHTPPEPAWQSHARSIFCSGGGGTKSAFDSTGQPTTSARLIRLHPSHSQPMGRPSDHRSDRVLTLTWSRYDSASLTLRGRRLLLPPACCCCQVGEGRFGGMLWDMVGGVGGGGGEKGMRGRWSSEWETKMNNEWSWRGGW